MSSTAAAILLSRGQKARLALYALACSVLLLWDYVYFFYLLNFAICFMYFAVTVFKLLIVGLSWWRRPQIVVPDEEIRALSDDILPVYTVLIPLYKEANVVARIIRSIESLDFPKQKLDVKLLLEADDAATAEAVRSVESVLDLGVVIVPAAGPRTKPKACNAGLERARGELVVVYDAEDRPEPDQLKKAVLALRNAEPEVICLQCKLKYYNPHQNWLTRSFSIEYAAWFDLFLPGLHGLGLPIPLGGTSNHFRTHVLRELGGWDPYNLAEDCDLGIRIHARGYRTRILDSTTWEEANSRLWNWLRQRSRWIKGYIQTFLVFTRHPIRLLRQLGLKGFTGFLLTVGGFTLIQLLNPIYWIAAALHCVYRWRMLYPGDVVSEFFFAASITLAFSNILFIAVNLFAALELRSRRMAVYALLSPLYWALMSLAAWRGLLQLFRRPFYWEKTEHGLDLEAG